MSNTTAHEIMPPKMPRGTKRKKEEKVGWMRKRICEILHGFEFSCSKRLKEWRCDDFVVRKKVVASFSQWLEFPVKRERLDCKDVTQEYLVFRYSCEFSRNVGLTKTYFPFLPRNQCYILLKWICKSLQPERSIHIFICDSIKGLKFTFQRVKIGNTFSW